MIMAEKHVVVQGAILKCQFSVSEQTDALKVLTHSKHYANDHEGKSKLIATTKEIGETLEKNTFGKCKKQASGNDYLPCNVQITNWTGFYEKVTLSNKGKILLEDSKGTCPMGAPDCISIVKHGQKAELTKIHIMKADPDVMNQINPLLDMKAFQNELNGIPEVEK